MALKGDRQHADSGEGGAVGLHRRGTEPDEALSRHHQTAGTIMNGRWLSLWYFVEDRGKVNTKTSGAG